MCNISAGYFEDGFNKGQKSGFDDGVNFTTLKMIKNLMYTQGFSITEAMDALCVPKEQQEEYVAKLKEELA